jgi:hypothetical protein
MKKWLLAGIVVLMVFLHQDFWLWTHKELLLGFLPIGLAYHLGYSVLASLVMLFFIRTAWPKSLEELDAGIEERDQKEPKS